MNVQSIGLLVLLSFFLVAQSSAADPVIKRHFDIPYTDSGNSKHTLDLYEPAGKESRPVVVWVHGGGWRNGDKKGVQQKPVAFTRRGYVFVSVNYRMSPEVGIPEMASDIAAAIAWLSDHAAEYQIDPQHIVLAGHSAGAHLAALVATDETYLNKQGIAVTCLAACVPVDTAMYDVPAQLRSVGKLRSRLYDPVFTDDVKKQSLYSPITHVSPSKTIPPFMILHVADRADSTAQSRAFGNELNSDGAKAFVVAAEGKNHGTINRDLGSADDLSTKAVFEFLETCLSARSLRGSEP